ncbi:MAG: hypothetical protein FWE37_02670 [Spirochaetaceae bacterium]|nr:hypothetical protein [Spirochaetaceae bacterium]
MDLLALNLIYEDLTGIRPDEQTLMVNGFVLQAPATNIVINNSVVEATLAGKSLVLSNDFNKITLIVEHAQPFIINNNGDVVQIGIFKINNRRANFNITKLGQDYCLCLVL